MEGILVDDGHMGGDWTDSQMHFKVVWVPKHYIN